MVQPCTFRNLLRPAAGQLILSQDNTIARPPAALACYNTSSQYPTRSSLFNMMVLSALLLPDGPPPRSGQPRRLPAALCPNSSPAHKQPKPISQFQEANMPPRTSTKFCSVPSQCPPISCQTNHRQQLLTQLLNIKAGQPATQDATQ